MTNTQNTAGVSAPASQPALVYTRMPTTASWTEVFYDGTCKVVEGRIEQYKPNWVAELCGNRGFSLEPETKAEALVEPSVAEDAPAEESVTEQATPSGQDTAAKAPKRPSKRSKGK